MVVCVWACVSGLLFLANLAGDLRVVRLGCVVFGSYEATRWLSWYGIGLASADRLPVVFEPLLVHSGVSSAIRRKATGADHKKRSGGGKAAGSEPLVLPPGSS